MIPRSAPAISSIQDDQGLLPSTEPVAKSPQKGRIFELDILRGIAVLLVLASHSLQFDVAPGVFHNVWHAFGRAGGVGVDIFFVLSGFLIGGLLFTEILNHGTLDVTRFIIRRGFKIWPSYYVFLFYYAAYLHARFHLGVTQTFSLLVPNLIHIQNYVSRSDLGLRLTGDPYWGFNMRHTWSLAVEEQKSHQNVVLR